MRNGASGGGLTAQTDEMCGAENWTTSGSCVWQPKRQSMTVPTELTQKPRRKNRVGHLVGVAAGSCWTVGTRVAGLSDAELVRTLSRSRSPSTLLFPSIWFLRRVELGWRAFLCFVPRPQPEVRTLPQPPLLCQAALAVSVAALELLDHRCALWDSRSLACVQLFAAVGRLHLKKARCPRRSVARLQSDALCHSPTREDTFCRSRLGIESRNRKRMRTAPAIFLDQRFALRDSLYAARVKLFGASWHLHLKIAQCPRNSQALRGLARRRLEASRDALTGKGTLFLSKRLIESKERESMQIGLGNLLAFDTYARPGEIVTLRPCLFAMPKDPSTLRARVARVSHPIKLGQKVKSLESRDAILIVGGQVNRNWLAVLASFAAPYRLRHCGASLISINGVTIDPLGSSGFWLDTSSCQAQPLFPCLPLVRSSSMNIKSAVRLVNQWAHPPSPNTRRTTGLRVSSSTTSAVFVARHGKAVIVRGVL